MLVFSQLVLFASSLGCFTYGLWEVKSLAGAKRGNHLFGVEHFSYNKSRRKSSLTISKVCFCAVAVRGPLKEAMDRRDVNPGIAQLYTVPNPGNRSFVIPGYRKVMFKFSRCFLFFFDWGIINKACLIYLLEIFISCMK